MEKPGGIALDEGKVDEAAEGATAEEGNEALGANEDGSGAENVDGADGSGAEGGEEAAEESKPSLTAEDIRSLVEELKAPNGNKKEEVSEGDVWDLPPAQWTQLAERLSQSPVDQLKWTVSLVKAALDRQEKIYEKKYGSYFEESDLERGLKALAGKAEFKDAPNMREHIKEYLGDVPRDKWKDQAVWERAMTYARGKMASPQKKSITKGFEVRKTVAKGSQFASGAANGGKRKASVVPTSSEKLGFDKIGHKYYASVEEYAAEVRKGQPQKK